MATRPDSTAQAALDARVRRPVTFCWLNILDDQIRVTDAPYQVTFTGTGDVDLDGFTFMPLDPQFVSVGPVKAKEGGSSTVTLALSGILGLDTELMDQIGDHANWRGREARLWRAMYDPDALTPIGGVWSFYTGYMSVPRIVGDARSQTIALDVESYIGFFSVASNRSYLDQSEFDSGDHSAELAIAIANGAGRPK